MKEIMQNDKLRIDKYRGTTIGHKYEHLTNDAKCVNMFNRGESMDMVKKLEIYRLENRISQQELAKRLKVSYNTVSRWFTGRFKPSKIHTYHIEKLLSESKKE